LGWDARAEVLHFHPQRSYVAGGSRLRRLDPQNYRAAGWGDLNRMVQQKGEGLHQLRTKPADGAGGCVLSVDAQLSYGNRRPESPAPLLQSLRHITGLAGAAPAVQEQRLLGDAAHPVEQFIGQAQQTVARWLYAAILPQQVHDVGQPLQRIVDLMG